ncbi:MAG: hypothetical protein JSV59_14015 [Flavobacteriaceae bacterium]|nr:MAG: hypothetical protein JSV59_14015 [Flavobacteriaceae bacterium]
MIGFFRKIRRKLADDNQFFKYSRYAIGEIVLVVVGILIALQINNWNNNRIGHLNEKVLLSYIIEDLRYDHEILIELIEQAQSKQSLHEKLYNESIAEFISTRNEPFSSEILELIFLLSKTWDNHQDAVEEISEKDLRSDLNKYFSDYNVTNNYVEIHNEAVIELRQYFRQYELLNLNVIFNSNPNKQSFDPNTLIHTDKFRALLGTKEFNSLLVELYLGNQDVIQWLETLSKRNEFLRSKLTEYLDQNK